MMNIAICADENYIGKVLILLVSIFENNKTNDICIFLLTDVCTLKDKERIHFLQQTYNKSIEVIEVSEKDFQSLPTYGHLSRSTYYRYLIPELCKVDKILYLDVDVLVNSSLRELWDIDISEYSMAVVEDAYSENIIESNRLGIYSKRFNNGVALMNLGIWRKCHITQQCISLLLQNKELFKFMDQDANNVLLHDDVLFIDFKYNMQRQFYGSKDFLFLHKDKITQINKHRDNPVIVHFNGPIKPWHRECKHPFRHKYLRYANMYPELGYREEQLYSLPYRIICKLLVEPSTKLLHCFGK